MEEKPQRSPGPEAPSKRGDWSAAGLVVALLVAVAIFVGATSAQYPIGDWLIWRYLRVIALALGWAVSCLGFGYVLLDRVWGRRGDSAPAAIAFPLGVFSFEIAIFLLGLLHLLGMITFVLLPVAFAYAGAGHLAAAARRLRALRPPTTFPRLAVTLLAVLGIALIYIQILSPEPFHWDARWYHLPIAQQYAVTGAVGPFPEGWFLGAYPHGASFIYTWAFTLPGVLVWDRLELCAHLEMVVFLATVASIPTLVRRLAPQVGTGLSWAVMFLFPGIYLYDSNLACAADHFAALWCIPLVLTLDDVWKDWKPRRALLFAIFVAAVLIAKYTAWSMLLFPGLLFAARGLWLAVSKRRAQAAGATSVLGPLAVAGGVMLLLSAPHWLTNWIWYGDPLYPALHKFLHSRPWSPEAAASFRVGETFVFPIRPGWLGVGDALAATLTFSFIPNDWPVFHRNVPVFGSLFTLCMLFLPFVRAGARIWLTYLGVMVAIVVWYLTNRQDRYLQCWLPAMVACTAAMLGLVWANRHVWVRPLVVVLIFLQAAWGGDVPFFPTHNLVHDSPIRLASNFLASGFLGTPHRLRPYGDVGRLGELLPRDATLLVHEQQLTAGLPVRLVIDQWQGRISYATLASPAAIYRELSDLKVTHLMWDTKQATGWNSVGSDLAFMNFAFNHVLEMQTVGELTFGRFPEAAPPEPFNDRVAMLVCGAPYPSGRYRLGKLTVPDPGQPWAAPEAPLGDVESVVRDSGFLVVEQTCAPPLPPSVGTLYHPPYLRNPYQLYIRRTR